MKTWTTTIACAALAFTVAYADEPTKGKPAGKSDMGAISLNPTDLKWSEAPPVLPKGAQVAVLRGDPFKPGPYTMRVKMPDGYKIPPHWHSQEEELTIMSGMFMLHMGDTMTSEPHDLDAGGYHLLPAKMHHGAEAKGETIVQVQGKGPFDIHYLNPADNPNPKAASR